MRVKYSILVSLILLMIKVWECDAQNQVSHGAVIRGDLEKTKISLVFTGHEFAEGAEAILATLRANKVKGAFFLTGDFLRNPDFEPIILQMLQEGHYIGPHSDRHLHYCAWEDRDSLLIDKETFLLDLENNYFELSKFRIDKEKASFFIPPYEWYNTTISEWANEIGVQLINFTPGTRSQADYTDPTMANYIDSESILQSIWDYERKDPKGMNGFILLSHIGVGDQRTDKFYHYLTSLIKGLEKRGYQIVTISELIEPN
jgi:peptidoglycan/xylan/chitin deacetylase (PgdA/CDA1 family)